MYKAQAPLADEPKMIEKAVTIHTEGQKLVQRFASEHPSIKDIWLANSIKTDEEVLAVVPEASVNNLPTTYNNVRVITCTDDKNFKGLDEYDKCGFPAQVVFKERKKAREIMEKYGGDLMKNHSNLRAICVSPHKFIEADGKRVLDTCIALYCRGKGYLPKGEKEFPSELDGIPTDVREGHFLLGMRNRDLPDCTDVSRELRVGMRIHGKETGAVGTLGGFVKLKNDEIGFLTCAHVVHPSCQRNTKAQAGSTDGYEVIYNPDTVFGCFQYGDRRGVSVDAAVVTIDKSRCPSDGFMTKQTNCALRNCGFTENNPPVFTGETVDHCEDVSLDSMLIKCGAESGLTAGLLQSDGAQVRLENAELKLQFRPSDDRIIFYNQYIVRSVKDITFFELGDSGSLVFAKKRQQREDGRSPLLCFGMAIGHLLDGGCVVTPIHDVLQSLGLSKDDFVPFPHGSFFDDDGDDEDDNDDYPSGGNDGVGKQTGKKRFMCKREDTGKKRGINGKFLESTKITKKKDSSDRSSTFGFTINPKNTKSNKGEPQQNLYENKSERYYLPLGPADFPNSTVSGQLLGNRDDERNNQGRQTTNSSARREPCVSNYAYSFKGSQNDTLKGVQILERKQVFGTSSFSSNTDLPTLPSVSTRYASHDVRVSDAVNITPSVYDKDASFYDVSAVSPGAVNMAVQKPSSVSTEFHQQQPPARSKTDFPPRENYKLLNSPNARMSKAASYSTASLGVDSVTGAQADPYLSQLENVGRLEANVGHPMTDLIHDPTDMSWQTSPECQYFHHQSRANQSRPEDPKTSCTYSANDVFQTPEELAFTHNQSETHLNHPLDFNTPNAFGRYDHNTEEKQVYSSYHRSPYAGNPTTYSAELILAMQHLLQTDQIRHVAPVPTLSYKNDTKELTYCGDKHFSLSDERFTFSTNQTLVSASMNTTTVVQEDIRHDSGVVKKEDENLPKHTQGDEKQVPGTNKEETRTLISLNKNERSLKIKCVEGFLYFLYLVAKSYLDGYIG